MFCYACGKPLPEGAQACPACGTRVPVPPPPPGPAQTNPTDQIIADLKRSAKDLGAASARLSKRLAEKADSAAHDPKGSAKRVAHRINEAAETLAHDVDKLLQDL
jgi:hypothetical protein